MFEMVFYLYEYLRYVPLPFIRTFLCKTKSCPKNNWYSQGRSLKTSHESIITELGYLASPLCLVVALIFYVIHLP